LGLFATVVHNKRMSDPQDDNNCRLPFQGTKKSPQISKEFSNESQKPLLSSPKGVWSNQGSF
jgi:hypothetical protein